MALDSTTYLTEFLRSWVPIRLLPCLPMKRSSRKHVREYHSPVFSAPIITLSRIAEHIKVNIDRVLHEFKELALLADKSVYLPSTRESSALCLKVDVLADATEEQKRRLCAFKIFKSFARKLDWTAV